MSPVNKEVSMNTMTAVYANGAHPVNAPDTQSKGENKARSFGTLIQTTPPWVKPTETEPTSIDPERVTQQPLPAFVINLPRRPIPSLP